MDIEPSSDTGNSRSHEEARVRALQSFAILDTSPEPVFDDLANLAAELCSAPMALVSLVDQDRQWFKARVGVALASTPRETSFCSHALGQRDPFLVGDTRRDQRFSSNPLVVGEPWIRAYAGIPLNSEDGYGLGSLCVLDTTARVWTARELRQLQVLADQVMAQLHLRRRTDELAASEERWRTLFQDSPVAIVVNDEQGRLTTVNQALCRLLGRTAEAVLGQPLSAFLRSDQPPFHRSGGARLDAAPNGVLELETCIVRPDGEDRWVWVSARRIAGPAGERWTFGHLQDITARKHSDEAAARSRADLAAVAEVVREVQAGTDARDRIVRAAADLAQADLVNVCEPDVEPGSLRVTATTDPELSGVVLEANERSAAQEAYDSGRPVFLSDASGHPGVAHGLLRQTSMTSMLVTPITSQNRVIAVLTTAWRDRVADLDDRRVKLIALLADQTGVALQQSALLTELDVLAHTDALTGLPNKRAWNSHLDDLVAPTTAPDSMVTVAIADLDRFKQFNDRHGHAAGDELLQRFATAAKAELRKGDTIARWGGEEFTISLPDCRPDEARLVLTRVLRAPERGQTCSIGFAIWNGRETADELMQRADAALYRAKHAGRNSIEQAPPEDG